jgi:secondary thiamine-phosphate synthase enzyme
MIVHHESMKLVSDLHKPMFHDVTEKAEQTAKESKIRNGSITVYSQHTTCSVIIQEESHDELYDGTKYLLQDMLDVFEALAPMCRREGQYLHPGAEHIEHAVTNLKEEAVWSLNTEAHIRSCLLGRSETMPIVEGKIELGEFGQIYFVDFDAVRLRERTVRFQLIGE